MYTIGVDSGGTFVDYVIRNEVDGNIVGGKVSSELGVHDSIRLAFNRIFGSHGIDSSKVSRVVHGTTLATNAILEMKGQLPVAVTTDGFRSLLELRRHDSPRMGSILAWQKEPSSIPKERIFEVPAPRAIDEPIDLPALRRRIEEFAPRFESLGVSSAAVCLVNGIRMPEAEDAVASMLREIGVSYVCTSHEIDMRVGEYERMTSTVLNAYLLPIVNNYLDQYENSLDGLGISAPRFLMASDGGMYTLDMARHLPIATTLSGPAAGIRAAAALAKSFGDDHVITFDVGGTSCDVSSIDHWTPDVSIHGSIGAFPHVLPVVDIVTIGAGGGSIAKLDAGRFTVGPESAGANPGPVAYSRGGYAPTLTDALAVLGWLPESVADGEVRLDAAAAKAAVQSQLAEGLDSDPDTVATDVVRLACESMANAIREVTSQQGRDPREYVLYAYGGAGPTLAGAVAALLGIRRIRIPRLAGVFSAIGLAEAKLGRIFTQSVVPSMDLDEEQIWRDSGGFPGLERQAAAYFDNARLDDGQATISLKYSVGLHYADQSHALPISIPSEDVEGSDLPGLTSHLQKSFTGAHRRLYGYVIDDAPVQVAWLRIEARAQRNEGGGAAGQRSVSVPEALRTPIEGNGVGSVVANRDSAAKHGERGIRMLSDLGPGSRMHGPAVVSGTTTTIVIPEESVFTVMSDGTSLIEFNSADSRR